MNYINYISFIVMIASNHFLKSKVKNSKRWYLLGRTSRGFYDVDLHFIVVILHLSSFVDVFHFVVASSFDFQATLPCHRHSTLASQACEDLHQLWSLPQLLLQRALRFWVGIFLPTGVFYLTLLPNIFGTFPTFWHNLLL